MRCKTRRGRFGRIMFRLIAVIPIGLGLPACTSHGGPATASHAAPPSPASVYASDAQLAWERDAPADFARFEFGRNDGILGGQPAVAIRATDQWPEALRPIERPVVFGLYQQDRSGHRGRYDGRRDDRGYRSGRDRSSRRDNGRWYRGDRGSYNGRYRRPY